MANAPNKSRTRETLETVALAVSLAFTSIRIGIAQAYVVDGPSMEPSLVHSQRLFVLRAAYGLSVPFRTEAVAMWSQPAIGDVVVIESPMDDLDLVKRVVGVAGDTIEVRDGILMRNGAPAASSMRGPCDPAQHVDLDPGCVVFEETLGGRSWTTSRSTFNPYTIDVEPTEVPPGTVFVMGDHRDHSNDSRFFGPVPLSHLRGRVLFVD